MKLFHSVLLDKSPADGGGGAAAVADIRKNTREAEMSRLRNINKAVEDMIEVYKTSPGAREKLTKLAREHGEKGTGVAEFNALLLGELPGMRKAEVESLGMSEGEVKKWSLQRAIASAIQNNGKVTGCYEREISDEFSKKIGQSPEGFFIPTDIICGVGRSDPLFRHKRDLNVTTAAQGGQFVQTTVQTPIIEILRNRMVTQRLGVQTLSGLSGNIAIPRQTGAATAYSAAEQAALTKSTQSINQVALSPKRVGAWNAYSKMLLLQSSVDVENFVRDDLMKVLAIKIDNLVLQGQGGNEPLGIRNTTGIGSVTFGGTATWAMVIAFETALAAANADVGRMAYVTDATVRGSWKKTLKVAGSTFPIYLWEPGEWNDGFNDGEVNAYRAAATNQITDHTVGFGNYEDDIVAMWGGYDVVIDPYTSATSGTVNIIINAFLDNAVRHSASFAWSTDAGNQ